MSSRHQLKIMCSILLAIVVIFTPQRAEALVDIVNPIPNDVNFTYGLKGTEADSIIRRAVALMNRFKLNGVVAVTDREGHILGVYRNSPTSGANANIFQCVEQATAKARTASFFESDSNAFSTITAFFIVQAHFPPGVRNFGGGPLYGVPFSNFPTQYSTPPTIPTAVVATGGTLYAADGASAVQLQVPPFIVFIPGVNCAGAPVDPGTAVDPTGAGNTRPNNATFSQPLVITPLTDDLGGLPLYKWDPAQQRLRSVGGVGVEIDAFGILHDGFADRGSWRLPTPTVSLAWFEEACAVAAQSGFFPPNSITASTIFINGFRLPYYSASAGYGNSLKAAEVAAVTLGTNGAFEPYPDTDESERNGNGGAPIGGPYPAATPIIMLAPGTRDTPRQEIPRQGFVPRFPPRDTPIGDGSITAGDVRRIVQQGADTAFIVRGAIRNPIGLPAAVWITVVDVNGNICGLFRTFDATYFSFDVAAQKGRTAAFFSDNTVGFTSRAIGFMAQPFYPPGIDSPLGGPLTGRQNAGNVYAGNLVPVLASANPNAFGCGTLTQISQLLLDDNQNVTSFIGVPDAVQKLARRLPHIYDGRISPLQAAVTVDLSLGQPGETAPPRDPIKGFTAPYLPNGFTIFPGGVPIYKNGVLVGAVGVSGDGVDQDDIIAYGAAQGYLPPAGVQCDAAPAINVANTLHNDITKLKAIFTNLTSAQGDAVLDVADFRTKQGAGMLRGLRLPFVKFPRNPYR